MLRWAYAFGRMCMSVLFIVSGIQKFWNVGGIAKMLIDNKIPVPVEVDPYLMGIPRYEAAGYLIAAIETICGLMILAGFAARWAALVLAVFTACTIIFVHHFWDMEGAAAAMNQIHALKNLAIMGGLLLIVAGGSHIAPVQGRPA